MMPALRRISASLRAQMAEGKAQEEEEDEWNGAPHSLWCAPLLHSRQRKDARRAVVRLVEQRLLKDDAARDVLVQARRLKQHLPVKAAVLLVVFHACGEGGCGGGAAVARRARRRGATRGAAATPGRARTDGLEALADGARALVGGEDALARRGNGIGGGDELGGKGRRGHCGRLRREAGSAARARVDNSAHGK